MIFFPVILRSTVITRFVATMMTLTSAGRRATFLRWQISCVHGTILCLTYDHQPPQHSPRQVPYLRVVGRRSSRRGFAID